MIATNPNPSPTQLESWRRLWVILLAPADHQQAQQAQSRPNEGKSVPDEGRR